MDKKFALVVSFCFILVVGNMIYLPQMLSQFKNSQDQYIELSKDYQRLQEAYDLEIDDSGPRYTGNPFATERWPGQLQSENITGMHWYSYYGGELVNVTDNVLGLGELALEGDYDTWSHVWTRDYGAGATWIFNILVDNSGTVYAEHLSDSLFVKTYGGAETNVANYHFGMHELLMADPMSATGKYMLGTPVYSTEFEVWKDGVQTFSRDVQLDEETADELFSLSISPNGKFVALGCSIEGSLKQLVFLYEGS